MILQHLSAKGGSMFSSKYSRILYSTILVIVLMMLFGVFYFKTDDNSQARHFSLLQKVGDQCSDVAERSVANKIPIIEFQKLELISKKAHVLKLCMQDHGFYENPAWLVDAKSIAAKNAKAQNISADEALENLKRDEMLIFNHQSSHPPYWQAPSKKPLSQPI